MYLHSSNLHWVVMVCGGGYSSQYSLSVSCLIATYFCKCGSCWYICGGHELVVVWMACIPASVWGLHRVSNTWIEVSAKRNVAVSCLTKCHTTHDAYLSIMTHPACMENEYYSTAWFNYTAVQACTHAWNVTGKHAHEGSKAPKSVSLWPPSQCARWADNCSFEWCTNGVPQV